MGERFTIRHLDELEHPWPQWRLARKSLGLSSFGMNVAELAPGESIPEHHELDRDQEEVFVVLAGTPTIVVDGQDHPLRPARSPASTLRRCATTARRSHSSLGDRPPISRVHNVCG